MNITTSYNNVVFQPVALRQIVTRVARNIDALRDMIGFGAIAVTGKSGMAIAFPVSMMIQIPVVLVRKKNEISHGRGIEGSCSLNRFIILDDFIDTGATVESILGALEWDSSARCVAVCTYSDMEKELGLAADSPGPVRASQRTFNGFPNYSPEKRHLTHYHV